MGANLEDFTIDQAAGAFALTAGAIGSLLLVIWQSKCHCKINLCWIFKCERKPIVDEQKKPEGEEDVPTVANNPTPTDTDTPRSITLDPNPINFSFDMDRKDTIQP